MKKIIVLLVFTFGLMLNFKVLASHNVGGKLSYKCIAPNTYLVKASFYRDCSGISVGINSISIGYYNSCGRSGTFTAYRIPSNDYEITPQCVNTISRCKNGFEFGIEAHHFEGILILPNDPDSCQQWHVYYIPPCCRGGSITLYQRTAAYYNAFLDNSNGKCNNSVGLELEYLPKLCINKLQRIDFIHTETDGDSIHFEFDTAKQPNGIFPSSGSLYRTPYTPLRLGASSTPFIIDSKTGTISFTPTIFQEISFVIKASEYRDQELIGFVTLEILISVEAMCGDLKPTYLNDTITKNKGWQNLKVDFDTDILCRTVTPNGSDFILLDPQFQPIPIISAQRTCGSFNETNQLDFQLAYPVNRFGTFYLISKLGSDTNTVRSICRQDMAENDTLFIISGFPTNTNNLTQNYQLKTFPNPTNGELNIDFNYPEGKNLNINIYNLLGTKVHQENIETFDGNYQGILNLNHLPNQTYILELETQFQTIKRKIVLLSH